MKNEGERSRFGLPAAMVVFFILVLKYQDTDFFQSTMRFLFNPDHSLALPPFWQENRVLIIGGLVLALLAFYRPVWRSYRYLVEVLRNSPQWDQQPELSVVKASYLYRGNKAQCVVAWLIDLCARGGLILEYRKGGNPWFISRGSAIPPERGDQERMELLFQDGAPIRLYAPLSAPQAPVLELADHLYGEITETTRPELLKGQSSLAAWVVFLALIAEIPFFLASQSGETPGTLVIALFSAVLVALPAYVLCDQLPVIFSPSRGMAYLKLSAVILFALFGHWVMMQTRTSAPLLATMFFPDLVVVLIVFVRQVPRLPKDPALLTGIIGYAKHLSSSGHLVSEKDLPWTLGLGLYADLYAEGFCFDGTALPLWLRVPPGEDSQEVMKLMHQTLGQQVNKAVYGEMDSKSRLSTGGMGWRH